MSRRSASAFALPTVCVRRRGARFSSIATAAETTLLDAAERGDRAAALKLLTKGAEFNAPGLTARRAIMYAAANDDLELVAR